MRKGTGSGKVTKKILEKKVLGSLEGSSSEECLHLEVSVMFQHLEYIYMSTYVCFCFLQANMVYIF